MYQRQTRHEHRCPFGADLTLWLVGAFHAWRSGAAWGGGTIAHRATPSHAGWAGYEDDRPQR